MEDSSFQAPLAPPVEDGDDDEEEDEDDDDGDGFGDDFDDFEEGNQDDDFDDFEDGFQQAEATPALNSLPPQQQAQLPFVSLVTTHH